MAEFRVLSQCELSQGGTGGVTLDSPSATLGDFRATVSSPLISKQIQDPCLKEKASKEISTKTNYGKNLDEW